MLESTSKIYVEEGSNAEIKAALIAYIRTGIKNAVYNLKREEEKEALFREITEGDAVLTFEQMLAQADSDEINNTALKKAFDGLSKKQKSFVTLHYFRGFNTEQIAKGMGVSQQAASQIHKRAPEQLKLHIDQIKAEEMDI